MQNEYRVNAKVVINVELTVCADDKEDAKKAAIQDIYNKNFEMLDIYEEPVINHVDVEYEEEDDPCPICYQTMCDCGGDYL